MSFASKIHSLNFQDYTPEFSLLNSTSAGGAVVETGVLHKSLEERTVKLGSSVPDYSNYAIDGILKAQIPSEQFRRGKASHWEKAHSTAKTWAWIGVGCTALFGISAYNARASQGLAVTFVVAGVASFILSMINISRIPDASHQIEGWKIDPLVQIANDRADAYKKGFAHVYEKKLKNEGISNHQILHPVEVKYLFEKYFPAFCSALLGQRPQDNEQKTEWFKAFTRCNPVSSQVLKYAYGTAVPGKYAQVSRDYDILHNHLADLSKKFEKIRTENREQNQKNINSIEEKRALTLNVFGLALSHFKQAAGEKRDQILKGGKKTPEDVFQNYQNKIQKYELAYTAICLALNTYFDGEVSKIQANLSKNLTQINNNENEAYGAFFN